jgi:hypothetical protein
MASFIYFTPILIKLITYEQCKEAANFKAEYKIEAHLYEREA